MGPSAIETRRLGLVREASLPGQRRILAGHQNARRCRLIWNVLASEQRTTISTDSRNTKKKKKKGRNEEMKK
jgi:hypothetical protein